MEQKLVEWYEPVILDVCLDISEVCSCIVSVVVSYVHSELVQKSQKVRVVVIQVMVKACILGLEKNSHRIVKHAVGVIGITDNFVTAYPMTPYYVRGH